MKTIPDKGQDRRTNFLLLTSQDLPFQIWFKSNTSGLVSEKIFKQSVLKIHLIYIFVNIWPTKNLTTRHCNIG